MQNLEQVSLQSQPLDLRSLYGQASAQQAITLIARAVEAQRQNGGVAVHLTADEAQQSELEDMIRFFAPDMAMLSFPDWDCIAYDRVSPKADIMGRRMQCLSALLARQSASDKPPMIVLASVQGSLRRLPPFSAVASGNLTITKGACIAQDDLIAFLAGNGYERSDTVREAGGYAVRGGIVDIFTADGGVAARLDFFGDEVDSLKAFDPASQRSEGAISSLSLTQACEVVLTAERVQSFRKNFRDLFGVVQGNNPLYETISDGRRYEGMEHWLPLFFDEKLPSLFDYCGASMLVSFGHQAQEVRHGKIDQILDFYDARVTLDKSQAAIAPKGKGASAKKATAQHLKKMQGSDVSLSGAVYHPVPTEAAFSFDPTDVLKAAVQFSPFQAGDEDSGDGDHILSAQFARDFKDIRAQQDHDLFAVFKDYVAALQHTKTSAHKIRHVVLACYSEGARARIKTILENAGFDAVQHCDDLHDVRRLKKGQLGLGVLPMERGFINAEYAFISEQDLLGDRLVRKTKKRKKDSELFIREVSSLNVGDFVVHEEHGVGRFEGLFTVEAAGTLHDCLKITYGGDDRLFVPVENIEVLSRFGGEDSSAVLDKLGGAGWQARKARVKKDLMELAGQLIDIAAARQLQKAPQISVPEHIYQEFAARFPYHETEDQMRSIEQVLEDIALDVPMDRLVCGDVGFGKTEVALRAAFVASMAGYQVALAVPTTLLARQHYNEFVKRFQGFGIKVAQLSRLVSAKESALTKKALQTGDVQVVVGTHALFAESVAFNNLGLVIVDEEQRFGVKQKERLKNLKKDVHVLTLTATPIPRTLQMSLAGIRDLSLITTPPVDRLAIRNFVMPFDPLVVREAIMREHYRGGQSFIVCPRVKDLGKVEDILAEIVPEIRVVSAHGQLSPQDLEGRMSAFYDRQYDILLATNIIESGIDVPSANTLIVYRSDLFGLSQLYQIRGRVGRSKQRAYAYLTYLPNQILTQDAQKRLEVLDMLDTLGGGFQLASHDMDIRGAGNLVGEQQSGHMKEVGVELYHHLLEEAVMNVRADRGLTEKPANDGSDGESGEAQQAAEQKPAHLRVHWVPEIQLGMSVLIPEKYVPDLNVRLSLYRRLSELVDQQDIDAFAAELVDRFGPLPEEVENLLETINIKRLCRLAGVSKIDAGPKGAVVGFYENTPPNPEKVLAFVTGSAGMVKLRSDQKLGFTRVWTSAQQRLDGVRSILKKLGDIAA